ncbi:hypothetical protein QAD02_012326 [Eretmocerus hayati]|uniref:Uncharacterized protein n=1 Tax=Eretmocerus hayati TaxID=131215 RepID=A0ACC2NZ60_9HYME|nr:hypothetical protein QAD02_012326 [Eretmocerus hayati]
MKHKWIIFYISLVCLSSESNGYRILAVFPANVKSHNIVFEALIKGLLKHEHHVDHITHYPTKTTSIHYRNLINLDGLVEKNENNITMEFVSRIGDRDVDIIATSYGNRLCHFMGLPEFQELIKGPARNEPYDLVITEAFGAHCFMGLGYVYNVPVVAVASGIEYPWISYFIGNSDNLAFVPNAYHVGVGSMTFWERLKNFYTNFIFLYRFHALTGDDQTESMRKYLRSDIPHIREVEKNVALTLVNNNPILFGVKPVTPGLIHIAGLHVNASGETLATELKNWMDSSIHGVVYFSFGSMVLIETLPHELLSDFYRAFKNLSPMRVLIKIANSTKLPAGLPENVKTLPWITQQPVLAHPNTRVFITHGGLGGLLEALYYGTPMVGVPLFSDQFRNVESFVRKGMMIRIDYDNLSGTTLESALRTLLDDPSYREKTHYYSRLFRDQPLSPMQNAIFWIEYVARNGGGVLKSPALALAWWQLAQLDIYACLMIILILGLGALISSVSILIKVVNNVEWRRRNKIKMS